MERRFLCRYSLYAQIKRLFPFRSTRIKTLVAAVLLTQQVSGRPKKKTQQIESGVTTGLNTQQKQRFPTFRSAIN